jgi:hypothetical protein
VAVAREYLGGDPSSDATTLARQLAAVLPMTDYARREHRIAAIAAQVSLSGFRVDIGLLATRRAEARARKEVLLNRLHSQYGLPITRKDGKSSASPQVTEAGRSAIKRGMRERFPRLVEWRVEVRALAKAGELLDNGFGRMMRPNPWQAHTQAPALMGQGCARDLLMEGLLRLQPELLPMVRLQVHDEVVLSVPVDQADEVERAVIAALFFEWAPAVIDRSRSLPVSAAVVQVGG